MTRWGRCLRHAANVVGERVRPTGERGARRRTRGRLPAARIGRASAAWRWAAETGRRAGSAGRGRFGGARGTRCGGIEGGVTAGALFAPGAPTAAPRTGIGLTIGGSP